MDNPVFDATIMEIILEMRRRAHLLNAWMNPRVSREATILNRAADELEELNKPPLSEFDKLMK